MLGLGIIQEFIGSFTGTEAIDAFTEEISRAIFDGRGAFASEVGQTAAKGLSRIMVDVPGRRGDLMFVEQNPATASRFARQAQAGEEIVWIYKQGVGHPVGRMEGGDLVWATKGTETELESILGI